MGRKDLPAVCSFIACWLFCAVPLAQAAGSEEGGFRPAVIRLSPRSPFLVQVGAREVRRLWYLKTGAVLPIEASLRKAARSVVLLTRKQLAALSPPEIPPEARSLSGQSFLLTTAERSLYIIGGSPLGVLYGAYRLGERLGFRFYLHGETLPPRMPQYALPSITERGSPLFELRGIQPFHDFPEGPDWWSTDDYLAVLAQLVKLRANFIGLHTYPERRPNAEPTVWIGLPEDVQEDGKVRFAYPASYHSTLRGNWGYRATPTGKYHFGASALFPKDCYGSEVMEGLCPRGTTPEQYCRVFHRAAALLRRAFSFARLLGIQTCVGTETPLVVPQRVRERLAALGGNPDDPAVRSELYEGIFRYVQKAYPLSWYWFWTPEGWTWRNVAKESVEKTLADLRCAFAAYKRSGATFRLATCGWVLGPQQDRALFDTALPGEVALSCINRQVGNEPVDSAFARVRRKDKWAIPWLEDDPGLTMPQLWVGRMREDAALALKYGASGLMGIHWRTRVLGPNVLALSWACWDQSSWRSLTEGAERSEGALGGQTASFPSHAIAGTEEDPLYQTVRYNMDGWHLAVPNGRYTVTLRFCEPHYREEGRRVFGVKLQGRTVIPRLDIFKEVGGNRALDRTFREVEVLDGLLRIEFIRINEFPCLAAFDITGAVTRKINAGGPAYKDWHADWPASARPPRGKPCGDFYADWARCQFGTAAGIARIFQSLDGSLPRPATWVGGPGGLRPEGRPWNEVEKQFDFCRRLAALRPQVTGPENLARFDWWLNSFRYLRAMAKVRTTWHRFNQALAKAKAAPTPEAKRKAALTGALPVRRELVRDIAEVYRYLLLTVSNPGELGTIANWEQHILPPVLHGPQKELERLLGSPLEPGALLPSTYGGPPRIIVPTVRTSVFEGEVLHLRVLVLSALPPVSLHIAWRHGYGSGPFEILPLRHVARGVYEGSFPPGGASGDGLQYFVEASFPSGPTCRFPPRPSVAPQTLCVMPRP